MKKLMYYISVVCLLCMVGLMGTPARAHADFPERPVAFVVIDHDGDVNGAVYKEWRSVVKWAYHFPYYKITDGGAAQQLTGKLVSEDVKLDKKSLATIAKESGNDVVVIARIYDMDENMTSGFGFRFDEHETYVIVELRADLFVYKVDGDKFLQKRIRERDVRDLGNFEHPEETLKWELSKIVNTMEGRPIIGE